MTKNDVKRTLTYAEQAALRILIDLAWEAVSAIDFAEKKRDGFLIERERVDEMEAILLRLKCFPAPPEPALTVDIVEYVLRRILVEEEDFEFDPERIAVEGSLLLTQTDTTQPSLDPALVGIAAEMTESGGHWQPCTGCYDTEDGHPTQKYDFSPALQTPIGCGCHECGGIGAVWWHMTEAELASYADDMDAIDDDPIDAIQRLMDKKGLTRKDLFPAKSRASECMSRKRPLSIKMIRKLHFEHGIPAETLIAPYRAANLEDQP